MDTLESELFEVGASHDMTVADESTVAFIEYAEGDCGSVFELDGAGNRQETFELSDYFPGMKPPECHVNAIHYGRWGKKVAIADKDI
jgi:hypothetical protein